jgi:hypothetical protein
MHGKRQEKKNRKKKCYKHEDTGETKEKQQTRPCRLRRYSWKRLMMKTGSCW